MSRARSIGTPNLFSARPVEILAWVPASTSGLTRQATRAVRQEVGFVFQNPENQIVFPIVREDMEFGLKARVPDKAARQARAAEQLAALGVGHLADRASHTLSGGERQLVALAAVLVMQPKVIVFDEPTTQLDLRNRNRVRAAIDGLAWDCPCPPC